jgi:hypothetical protein
MYSSAPHIERYVKEEFQLGKELSFFDPAK